MSDGLTLEKLRIDERLREVEKHMAEAVPVRDNILASLNRLETSVIRLEHKIVGNGTPGIEHRVLKLESAEELRQKQHSNIMKVAIGAITALMISIASFIGKIILAFAKNGG